MKNIQPNPGYELSLNELPGVNRFGLLGVNGQTKDNSYHANDTSNDNSCRRNGRIFESSCHPHGRINERSGGVTVIGC
jgi:hypothetical protein